MPTHRANRRLPLLVAGAVVAAAVGVGSWVLACAGTASAAGMAGTLSGTLYRSPNSAAISWVKANPADPRAAVIRDRITTQPTARWFTSANTGSIQGSVASYVGAANAAGQIPQLIPYALPNRDCGGASAGGAPDIATYRTWAQNFAKGMGTRTAIVLLEPDSLALITCLSGAELAERNAALAFATQAIKRSNPNARVYLDGGHSSWNPAAEQARRLTAAGVRQADGFYTNLSNFRLTANEISYGRAVLGALNDSSLHQVIDVSRNGAGPLGSQWCDPAGRLIGPAPTTSTGQSTVDAFVWAKPPGESDGCRAGAGTFVPDLAFELAGKGKLPRATTKAPARTTAATRPVATRSPVAGRSATPAPASGTPVPTPAPATTVAADGEAVPDPVPVAASTESQGCSDGGDQSTGGRQDWPRTAVVVGGAVAAANRRRGPR